MSIQWPTALRIATLTASSTLPEDYIKKLIEMGGAKVNVSTELKRTMIDAEYEYIAAHREEYDPGKVDEAVRVAIRNAVGHWIDILGCAGKA